SGTVKQVNEVIAGATTQFPPPAEDESLDDLDAAFAPSASAQAKEEGAPKSTAEGIASLVAAVCSGMRRDVTRLGDRLRNPTVMGDPWMLIQDLLEFRGRVRLALGELIYQVCSFIAVVDPESVVPRHLGELDHHLRLQQLTPYIARQLHKSQC